MSYFRNTEIQRVESGYDAWGRNKAISDYSLFSGLFTYDVPPKMWKELSWNGTDFIELPSFVNASSANGELIFKSGATLNDFVELRSQQHMRYQPNRGHLYSTAVFLPTPTANGIRRWGLILPCNGVFFELVGTGAAYTVNFVVRNHFVDTKIDITNDLPAGIDLEKGNLWDFQMQWRGVGDFKLLVNQELIHATSALGTRDKVSVENPSLPVGYELKNTGAEVTIKVGCVDVTSEGGKHINAEYTSFSTGTTLPTVTAAGTAVICVRMPYKINYDGADVCYSRDAILNQITAFCKDESVISVYAARAPHLNASTGLPSVTYSTNSGEFIEYAIGGNGTSLDNAFQVDKAAMKLIYSVRQEKDFAVKINNPAYDTSPFIITANTYLVVELDPDANTTGGVTMEISEQI